MRTISARPPRAWTLSLAAAAVVAALAAAPAGAKPPEPFTVAEEAYTYDVDASLRQVGPLVRVADPAAHRPGPADVAAAPGRPASTPAPASGKRRLSAALSSGCRGVAVARVGRTLLGFVAYKYWQYKEWCWSYPRVTGAQSWVYISDVDPNYYFRGTISAWGDFYTWCCGVWNSGHRSFRQGHFQNCILKWGCVRSEYPWVMIYGHGDGSFSYSTGS